MFNKKWVCKYQVCVANEQEAKVVISMIPWNKITDALLVWQIYPAYITADDKWYHDGILIVSIKTVRYTSKLHVYFMQIPWLLVLEDEVPMDIADRIFQKYILWPPKDTIDWTHMPMSVWPDYQWKVRTTVTRDPKDSRKIISLHSKILPMANYYNTSAVMKTANEKETKELIKEGNYEVLAFKTRLGISEESIKLQMVRELDDTVDVDDVNFLIHEIF